MIKGFYHILLINHWYSIVAGQMRILLSSGLYNACHEINISCLGSGENREYLKKYFADNYNKLHIRYYSENEKEYEFPALQLIENDHDDYVGFYFHSKGVTAPEEVHKNHWREWLNEGVLNNWKLHFSNIDAGGYDISGVNAIAGDHRIYYSGNYWWFDSKYIKKLPKIGHLNKLDRYDAEQWIAMDKERKMFMGRCVEPENESFKINY